MTMDICSCMMILMLTMTQNEDVCLPESRKTDRDDVLLENHISSESEVEKIILMKILPIMIV